MNDENSFELYDYLISKCGKDSFKKLKINKIHSIYN